jgi:hypothetical protein
MDFIVIWVWGLPLKKKDPVTYFLIPYKEGMTDKQVAGAVLRKLNKEFTEVTTINRNGFGLTSSLVNRECVRHAIATNKLFWWIHDDYFSEVSIADDIRIEQKVSYSDIEDAVRQEKGWKDAP